MAMWGTLAILFGGMLVTAVAANAVASTVVGVAIVVAGLLVTLAAATVFWDNFRDDCE